MQTLPKLITLVACLLPACSKAPIDSAVATANAVSARFMAPLAPKDASHQAEFLIRTLDNSSECQIYIDRLRDAGRGSPYEGATQYVLVHTYDAAGKAGCVKPD